MKTMKTLKILSLAVVVSTVTASGVFFNTSAQNDMTPAERAAAAVELRQGLYQLLFFNLRPIGAMAQGAPFDAELAERNARRIAALAPMIPDVMATDTRRFNTDTRALDRIWDNMDDFNEKAQALMDNANAFADAAATGNRGTAMRAFRALGGSCGNCHDDYREDD